MSWRRARTILLAFVAVLALLLVAAIIVVQTGWFRNYVKQKIVSLTEEATGGRVDIADFDFDLWQFRATITGFVIHGNEPPGAAPFVRIAKATAGFVLFPGVSRLYDISYLNVDRPAVNVMELADGRTNIPSPEHKAASNTPALQTVIDLAVRRFEATQGLITVESRRQPWNIRGNDLRVQLSWDRANQSYRGGLSLQPVYVTYGGNTPVNFAIRLPLTLHRDRIDIKDGVISTPASKIAVNVSLENMRNPKFSARLGGRIALADLTRLVNLPVNADIKNLPSDLNFTAEATASNTVVQVARLDAAWGQSQFEAAGTLKSPGENQALHFNLKLALGQISRLLNVSARPDGTVLIDGNASLNASDQYLVTGDIDGRNLSFRSTGHNREPRVKDVQLISGFRLDPRMLDLTNLRLTGFGGTFTGSAALQSFRAYTLNGDLRNLDLGSALTAIGREVPYKGYVSGKVSLEGDAKVSGPKSLSGKAELSISPGRTGVPLSGQLNLSFNGASDSLAVGNSHLSLPHTNVTLSGSTSNTLRVVLTSRDLDDLLAAASIKGPSPIKLDGGQLTFHGTVTGALSNPRIAGDVDLTRFLVEGRQFDSLNAELRANRSGAAITNASLTRGSMLLHLAASVGLKDWTAPSSERVSADASITHGDLADLIALAGRPVGGFSGALTAMARITGTIGNPRGTVDLQAANGTIEGEPYTQMQAEAVLSDRQITIPTAYIQGAAGRVSLTAEYRHPRDSFITGQLHAHLQSTPVDLARIQEVREEKPGVFGIIRVDADVSGEVNGRSSPVFQPGNISGDIEGRGLRFHGVDYGTLNVSAMTKAQTVTYNVAISPPGSAIRVHGDTKLMQDYPTVLDTSVTNFPIKDVLVLVNRPDLPVRGDLSGTANFTGTFRNPQATMNVDLRRAAIYDQPIDDMRARAAWSDRSIDVPQLEVVSGPARIALSGRYDHPAGNLQQGNFRVDIDSNSIDVSRIRPLEKFKPGLGGVVQVSANAAGQVFETGDRLRLASLNARLAASGITAQSKDLGNLTFTANTNNSSQLTLALDSNLAGSSIEGRGSAALTGSYPVNAQLSFTNVDYDRLKPLLGKVGGSFDAVMDGHATMSGPVFKTDDLSGSLRLTRVSITTTPVPGGGKPVDFSNRGPIEANLDRGVIRIESAHLVGPKTDISATGTAGITGQALNLSVNAKADLGIVPNFDQDVYASGDVTVAATIRGSASAPLVNGQMKLVDAAFNYTGVTNGISKANGVIDFNGSDAVIRNLTAVSGGGRITLAGFMGYATGLRFGITANATAVRVRAQQGASVTIGGDVRLTGTTQNSIVSGNVTIEQFTYNPRSDLGSLLSRAGPPVESPGAPLPLLANMKLEIRIRSATGVAVQASLAENLQVDVDLRLRGTVSQPDLLGRVNINGGTLVFFGGTYTVQNGAVGFYNPVNIEPVLDIALETEAQGVHVTLRVSGPIDNMKLSYTSDPPLQFQEIVSLLAVGRAPTSDPTLLANQAQMPQQSFEQMGESAIVGEALANPVSNQLQRVFGVTKFNISPTFQSGSQVPTARLTLQQQISSNLTFTYTSALDDPNGQVIRIDWAFSPQYSAVADRDQNGIFSINFYYKRQFR